MCIIIFTIKNLNKKEDLPLYIYAYINIIVSILFKRMI